MNHSVSAFAFMEISFSFVVLLVQRPGACGHHFGIHFPEPIKENDESESISDRKRVRILLVWCRKQAVKKRPSHRPRPDEAHLHK